ncbi:MAG: VWA domain-containing protein [Thermoguttaceae bacterium]|nr:VWA domain-containing protein [Thermoguttaceae bacterium]MBQ9798421.1 VWA domain-containing protein [Thermoguttaceae bacterium]
MARKLPVYLLLDLSDSTAGRPLQEIANGVRAFVQAISSDPYALETMHIGVIAFDSCIKQVVPLTEAWQFKPPTLSASGGSALGEALKLVKRRAEIDVKKSTATERGDWKPVVVVMSAGRPTDDWRQGLKEFKQYKWGLTVACAAGDDADVSVLRQIADDVVRLNANNVNILHDTLHHYYCPVS